MKITISGWQVLVHQLFFHHFHQPTYSPEWHGWQLVLSFTALSCPMMRRQHQHRINHHHSINVWYYYEYCTCVSPKTVCVPPSQCIRRQEMTSSTYILPIMLKKEYPSALLFHCYLVPCLIFNTSTQMFRRFMMLDNGRIGVVFLKRSQFLVSSIELLLGNGIIVRGQITEQDV